MEGHSDNTTGQSKWSSYFRRRILYVSKLKKLKSDPTLLREGQLQCFLRQLMGKELVNNEIYDEFYPSGSDAARLCGWTKSYKVSNICSSSCNVSYVSETTGNLTTRIKEHFGTDKSSHVYKHSQCKNKCDENSFPNIDHISTKYQLKKMKETLHIHWTP